MKSVHGCSVRDDARARFRLLDKAFWHHGNLAHLELAVYTRGKEHDVLETSGE